MKNKDLFGLILLGGLGAAAYFLFNNQSQDSSAGGGGGNSQAQPLAYYYSIPSSPNNTPGVNLLQKVITPTLPAALAIVTSGIAADTRQAWTGVKYGAPGQPSVAFAKNTIIQAAQPGAARNTVLAAQAILAGAPPRIAAKVKAGRIY